MLEKAQSTPNAVYWTAREWAVLLVCSAAAIAKTKAFQAFQKMRKENKEQLAKDLRRQLPACGNKRGANLVLNGETDEES